MINSEKMSPEVLIYIQSIKKFFKSHEEAQEYFEIKGNEDIFFKHVTEISQKNFEETGEPELTLFQFEFLKQKISKPTSMMDSNDTVSGEREITSTGIFASVGNFGLFSLN